MFDNIVKNVGDNLRVMYINYPCQYNSDGAPLQSLGYLGTVSESLGCSVDLMDANFRYKPLTTGDIVSQIHKRKPHLIGMTLYTKTALYGYGLLEQLKDTFSECLYLAGGPHATILPFETLQHGFDIACRGEGERIIASVIGFLRGEKKLEDLRGISYLNYDGEHIYHVNEEAISDLDTLPIVNYDLFDSIYFSESNLSSEFHVFSSRGCPSKCTFCNSYGVFGTKYRMRSAENILQELELLSKKYKVRRINFEDDFFTLHRGRLVEVCEGMIKRDIKLKWTCYSKAGAIHKDVFTLMKRSGCAGIAYGIENVYPETIRLINKKTPIAKIEEAYRNSHNSGIPFKTNIMAGFPWESKESLRANIDFVLRKKMKGNSARYSLSILYPIPSTKIYEDFVDQYPFIRETWLNPSIMERFHLTKSNGDLSINFFNFTKRIRDEIKFLAFVLRIPSLGDNSTTKFGDIYKFLIFPFRKFIYSYGFMKVIFKLWWWTVKHQRVKTKVQLFDGLA